MTQPNPIPEGEERAERRYEFPTLWASEKDWERVMRATTRDARRLEQWLRLRTRGPNICQTWDDLDA